MTILIVMIIQIRSSRLLLAILAASILGIGSIIYLMYLSEAIALHSAIVLAVAGGIYAGFGLSDGKSDSVIIETLSALFFGVIAIVGVIYPVVLGIGFLLHAVWDYLHHCQAIDTKVRFWYPPFCAVYDCFVGVFLLAVYLK